MPRVELPELRDGRDGKMQLFKLVNQIKRRFDVTGNLGTATTATATLILPGDGDYVHVAGVTSIDYVQIVALGAGDAIELYFDDGLTLNHGTASPPSGTYALKLAGSINAVMAAGSKIRLRRDDDLSLMVEMWRGAA